MNPAQQQRRPLHRRRKATSDRFGKARGISRRKRARIAAERFNCRGAGYRPFSSPDAPGRADSGSN
jgi:hypothetical protein